MLRKYKVFERTVRRKLIKKKKKVHNFSTNMMFFKMKAESPLVPDTEDEGPSEGDTRTSSNGIHY